MFNWIILLVTVLLVTIISRKFAAILFKRSKSRKEDLKGDTREKDETRDEDESKKAGQVDTSLKILPYDVQVQIIKLLPWQTQKGLLKSKTIGKVVHDVFYETVFVYQKSRTMHQENLKARNEAYGIPDIEYPINKWTSFESPEAFNKFCYQKPMYTPNCLHYDGGSVLDMLGKLDIKVLRRFKRFCSFSPDLKNQFQNTGFIDERPQMYPLCQYDIRVLQAGSKEPMPLVHTLISNYQIQAPLNYCEFPNLTHLKLDGSRLKRLVKVDFRVYAKLQTLEMTVRKNSIGVTEECNLILPQTLSALRVKSVDSCSQLSEVYKLTYLLRLSVEFVDQGSADQVVDFKIPPFVTELTVTSDKYRNADKLVLGEFLETLCVDTVIGITDDLDLPQNLKEFCVKGFQPGSIHRGGNRCRMTDFSQLDNLNKLVMVGHKDLNLPSGLEQLELIESYTDCMKIFEQCPKLEVLKQEFVAYTQIHGMTIPSSLKEISWTKADVKNVVGGQGVERFTLNNNYLSQSFRQCFMNMSHYTVENSRIIRVTLHEGITSFTVLNTPSVCDFECPRSLKDLEIQANQLIKCKVDLNCGLEHLTLSKVECNLGDMLKGTGKCLKSIILTKCALSNLEFDLTGSSLVVFKINWCSYKSIDPKRKLKRKAKEKNKGIVKFPETLIDFDIGNNGPEFGGREAEWADLSLCNKLKGPKRLY